MSFSLNLICNSIFYCFVLQGLCRGGDGLAFGRFPTGNEDEESGFQEVRENGSETFHRQSSGEKRLNNFYSYFKSLSNSIHNEGGLRVYPLHLKISGMV